VNKLYTESDQRTKFPDSASLSGQLKLHNKALTVCTSSCLHWWKH